MKNSKIAVFLLLASLAGCATVSHNAIPVQNSADRSLLATNGAEPSAAPSSLVHAQPQGPRVTPPGLQIASVAKDIIEAKVKAYLHHATIASVTSKAVKKADLPAELRDNIIAGDDEPLWSVEVKGNIKWGGTNPTPHGPNRQVEEIDTNRMVFVMSAATGMYYCAATYEQ